MIINTERGEVALKLGSTVYPMRPSFEAVIGFEQQTGKSLVELLRLAVSQQLHLADMAAIATFAIRAAAKEGEDRELLTSVQADRMAEVIFENGYTQAIPAIVDLLVNAVSGGKPATKKKAASRKSTTTAD